MKPAPPGAFALLRGTLGSVSRSITRGHLQFRGFAKCGTTRVEDRMYDSCSSGCAALCLYILWGGFIVTAGSPVHDQKTRPLVGCIW